MRHGKPKLGENNGLLLDQSYMAHPLYSGLSLIRHVGDGNILQCALKPHRHDIRPDRSGNLLQLFVRLTFGVVVVHIRL